MNDQRIEIIKLKESGLTTKQIAIKTGFSLAWVYRMLKSESLKPQSESVRSVRSQTYSKPWIRRPVSYKPLMAACEYCGKNLLVQSEPANIVTSTKTQILTPINKENPVTIEDASRFFNQLSEVFPNRKVKMEVKLGNLSKNSQGDLYATIDDYIYEILPIVKQ